MDGENETPNLLAITTLAWCYILSARLAELQGQSEPAIKYSDTKSPIQANVKQSSNLCVNVGHVNSRTKRWFSAILAPGRGFEVVIDQQDTCSPFAPWLYSLASDEPFSIVGCSEDNGIVDNCPLTSQKALHSLVDFAYRYGFNTHQLHAALATAVLLPTHQYRDITLELPRPETDLSMSTSAKIGSKDITELFLDLPCYITLSCSMETINSTLCGIYWNPHITCNFTSPWLQPLLDIPKRYEGNLGRYWEILALLCARRAPNVAYLSIGASISGLMPRVLEQVLTAQLPLMQHAFAWTGVPQSFLDLPGTGNYRESHSSEACIKRSDCWRLRKLPPAIDDDLHYQTGPFTPWAPAGYGLLKNRPLSVQMHRDCDRRTLQYQGSTWHFANEHVLENDLGRDKIIEHICRDRVPQINSHVPEIRFRSDQETSIEASISAFRWVLDNGEGTPPEEAYRDPWLLPVFEADSESDKLPYSSTEEDDGNCSDESGNPKDRISGDLLSENSAKIHG